VTIPPEEDTTPHHRVTVRLKAEEGVEKQVQENIEKELAPYLNRLEESFNRTADLVEVSKTISNQQTAADILRAAVVVAHAYLEDFLRTLATALLPERGERSLDEVPLAGLSGRAEKFLLGKLAQHRGKLVDDVLRQSVSEYLERSSFNSTDEIARLLETLGFKVSDFNQNFAAIDQMITRRHQIVHRADKVKTLAGYNLQPIQREVVIRWMASTLAFMQQLVETRARTYQELRLPPEGE
jgi:hypothetical protein